MGYPQVLSHTLGFGVTTSFFTKTPGFGATHNTELWYPIVTNRHTSNTELWYPIVTNRQTDRQTGYVDETNDHKIKGRNRQLTKYETNNTIDKKQ